MSLLNDSRAIFSAQNHTPSDSYCSLPVFRKWSLRSLPPPCWLLMPLWCTSVSLDTTTESWNEPLWNPFFLGGGSELPWWQVLDVSGSLYVYIYICIGKENRGPSNSGKMEVTLYLYIGWDNPSQIHRTKWRRQSSKLVDRTSDEGC